MLDRHAGDPAARATTFVVLDFEGTTPAGHPAEPIEVGAVLLRLQQFTAERWDLAEVGRFEAQIQPPAHAPVTAFDTRITAAMLAGRPDARTVLAAFDATLTSPPYVTVAHHATTEAGIIRRYATACPTLAAAPMLDTLRLARHSHPGLPNYQLDTLLAQLGVPIPPARHRALPDAIATAAVFQALLADGAQRLRWTTLAQLQALAGLAPPHQTAEQTTLF
jgi:DNA polymerase-3 subunit epsilon